MNFQKKHCVAMLLAGGQGSRLMVLTENTAKPAVPFGGKYRIIDFPLSNCVNSGIDTVGVLTQYQPLELNEYIGNGQPWRSEPQPLAACRSCRPMPRARNPSGTRARRTRSIRTSPFIERYRSGRCHHPLRRPSSTRWTMPPCCATTSRWSADCTIAVAHRPTGRGQPLRHHEHAARTAPSTNLRRSRSIRRATNASMGIYIFNWSVLKKFLIADEEDPQVRE